MTVLINTPTWLGEFEVGVFFLTNRETGLTLAMRKRGIAGEVRERLLTHAPDRVAETYSRILGPAARWERVHKRIPAHGEAHENPSRVRDKRSGSPRLRRART